MNWASLAKQLEMLAAIAALRPDGSLANDGPRAIDAATEQAADDWLTQLFDSQLNDAVPPEHLRMAIWARASQAKAFATWHSQLRSPPPTGPENAVLKKLTIAMWHECFRDDWLENRSGN